VDFKGSDWFLFFSPLQRDLFLKTLNREIRWGVGLFDFFYLLEMLFFFGE
jgi:hypothetical protein